MTQIHKLNIPLNRVEGDLELQLDVQDGVVADVWSAGTMYRGFENILAGRGAMDGLVITPRICGICSTAHLTAASRALDRLSAASVPDNARRIRNLALMTEHIQSDIRHGFLLFAPDFANPIYKDQPWFDEAIRRYAPLKGSAAIETIRESKKILELVAILGGQWPHSSFMVPGGVVSMPSAGDLQTCAFLLENYHQWYQKAVLGCTLERWLDVKSLKDLDNWLDENDSQRNSEVGFFIQVARALGLDKVGRGWGNFISYGGLDLPAETSLSAASGQLIPAGFAAGTKVEAFDQAQIAEHVAHSWFNGYQGGKHPFDGVTHPYATGNEGERYSWAKAPRYRDLPAETGPLAEMVIAGHPLFTDLVEKGGPNVLVRQLARLTRPTTLLPAMKTWLAELAASPNDRFYNPPAALESGEGFGLTEATRGALGHWVKIEDGQITHYQIISPTSWNGSPRDSMDVRGPWEQALLGTTVRDPENPVEVGHVIRSFDACLVCTVHSLERGKMTYRLTV